MPTFPVCKSREVVRALERAGFVVISQKGSHVKLRKGSLLTIVPSHGSKDVPFGTLGNILKQASLSIDEFKALL